MQIIGYIIIGFAALFLVQGIAIFIAASGEPKRPSPFTPRLSPLATFNHEHD